MLHNDAGEVKKVNAPACTIRHLYFSKILSRGIVPVLELFERLLHLLVIFGIIIFGDNACSPTRYKRHARCLYVLNGECIIIATAFSALDSPDIYIRGDNKISILAARWLTVVISITANLSRAHSLALVTDCHTPVTYGFKGNGETVLCVVGIQSFDVVEQAGISLVKVR